MLIALAMVVGHTTHALFYRSVTMLSAALVVGRTPKPPDAVLSGTTSRCYLLIVAHVPKTGGSTVSEVLQSLPDALFLGRPHSGHPRFFAAYGSLFDGTPAFSWRSLPAECQKFRPNASALEGSKCGTLPDWRNRRIVVDFHEPTGLAKFHNSLLPRLGRLRARYRESGCAMQIGSILRDPPSQMLSEFLYFDVQFNKHLHGNASQQEGALLNEWLPGRANPQTAWLRGRSCKTFGAIFLCSTPRGEPCGDGAAQHQQQQQQQQQYLGASEANATEAALRVVHAMDVVGTPSRLWDTVWLMAARVGVIFNATTTALPRCNPPSKHGLLTLSSLSPAARSALHARTRCDRRVYEAVLKREESDRIAQAELRHAWQQQQQNLVPFRVPFRCKSS